MDENEEGFPGCYMWLEGDSLAPPCQTDMLVVHRIIDMAQLKANDVLIDLGCGDGRICIEAAKLSKCRAMGVEIEEFLIERFRKSIETEKLHDFVSVLHGDLMEISLENATLLVLYLLPEALEMLDSKLKAFLSQPSDKCRRIICNTWGIKGLIPTKKVVVEELANVTLLLYTSASVIDSNRDCEKR